MSEKCEHDRCTEGPGGTRDDAAVRIYWPGKKPAALCATHGKFAFRLAHVMGFELPTVAINMGRVALAVQRMARELAVNVLRLCGPEHPGRQRIGAWEWCAECGCVRGDPPAGDGQWHEPAWDRHFARELAALGKPEQKPD